MIVVQFDCVNVAVKPRVRLPVKSNNEFYFRVLTLTGEAVYAIRVKPAIVGVQRDCQYTGSGESVGVAVGFHAPTTAPTRSM